MNTSKRCPKCGGRDLTQGELRGAGGFLSSFFDIAMRRFRTLVREMPIVVDQMTDPHGCEFYL